ncbi:hypothetical protein LOD99_1582 [Oopsacas minuta]|uniref:Uncharacterized protein n=1 Tax=Oopsacas minuta TaxID=111878 RepID=A0AAV7K3S3_9METZ|nr:hypothetical protein LOD99_1582 [Oopsacas minuta]
MKGGEIWGLHRAGYAYGEGRPVGYPTNAGYVFADDLDDDSYNFSLPLLIRTQVTPYYNFTSGQSELIPSDSYLSPLPPASPIPYASITYFTDHPLCSVCAIDDGNCTVSCSIQHVNFGMMMVSQPDIDGEETEAEWKLFRRIIWRQFNHSSCRMYYRN